MVTHSIADDVGLLEAIDTSATLDLHRSNLLRLQISELLEECQLDMEHGRWDAATQEYFQHLSSIIGGVSVVEKNFQELADKPVSVELLLHPSEHLKLSVEPIGCTKTRFGLTKKAGNAQVLPTFDYMVQIPSLAFSGKDYMNYRYFDKRSIIVNNVSEALSNRLDTVGTVKFVWIHGTNRPPLLRLQPPKAGKAPKFQVHLHFGMESIEWIPKLRLVPNRTNVKERGAKAQLYNHCLLYDARHRFEDEHIRQLVDHKSCEEALVLLQVWALQRGLWRNHDGWDRSSVALLMLYLLRKNKINPRMTPVQVFTVVLQTWGTTNWLGEKDQNIPTLRAAHGQDAQTEVNTKRQRTVLVLPEDGQTEMGTARSADLSKLYAKHTEESPLSTNDPRSLIDAYAWTNCYQLGPVFMDPSMSYNYLGGVSSNYMKLLSCHARKSLESLHNARSAFDILFMRRARFWQQWDLYVRVRQSYNAGEDWEFSVRRLLEKLESGLGNRLHGMRVLSNGNGDIAGGSPHTDQYTEESLKRRNELKMHHLCSPTGTDDVIIGLSINQETSQRLVDRGPPAEEPDNVQQFLDLWGKKAQLRRFKDGAIVQAVVWNEDKTIGFRNGGKWNGGYVEKIIRHLLLVHHTAAKVEFSFPSILSTIDDIGTQDDASSPTLDSLSAHQRAMKAFEDLSDFLRRKTGAQTGSLQTSPLGLPLSIDAVEPLSPSLRYSELFPPQPHPLLGGPPNGEKRISGAIMFDPILIQIRFGPSSKWPTDLKAIGAAKSAMLIQLSIGIEKSGDKDFGGMINVCSSYVDIGYRGYCFRIIVRADPEIQLLQRLVAPSAAASHLLKDLTQKHVVASSHHSTIHAVHTLYPSAASVVRLAKRWAASHLLSGHLTTEMIELLVAGVYTENSVFLQPPATVSAGFLRFLQLLATYDWAREPLIIDTRGHISDEDYDEIYQGFEASRGKGNESGLPMYVIAAYNRVSSELDGQKDQADASSATRKRWQPSVISPEWVVLSRAVYLAKQSYEYLHTCLYKFDDSWSSIFNVTPNSFKSYSVLMRVGRDFIVDEEISSTSGNLKEGGSNGILQTTFTRSMKARTMGPKLLRRKQYRNLRAEKSIDLLTEWRPIQDLVKTLQKRFGDVAVFFYNEFCPEVIGIAWRPQIFVPGAFSAMSSEFCYPVQDDWKVDTLIAKNVGDLLREISQYTSNIITSVRIFDDTCLAHFSKRQKISQQGDGSESVNSQEDSDE